MALSRVSAWSTASTIIRIQTSSGSSTTASSPLRQAGKSKLDHVLEMLQLIKSRGIAFQTVLTDSWYATSDVLKYLLGEKKTFYCPIKANRKIDDSKGKEPYKQVQVHIAL